VFIVLLTSCGFHLRGAYQLPAFMKTTYVQADNQSGELVRSLKRRLKANGIRIVDDVHEAAAVFEIQTEILNKRVLSVDSKGRAREYELNYSINFSLLDLARENETTLLQQSLKLEREFLFDTEDVLGKSREEATLVKDMQQDMVRLIMLRLQAYNESTSRSN